MCTIISDGNLKDEKISFYNWVNYKICLLYVYFKHILELIKLFVNG